MKCKVTFSLHTVWCFDKACNKHAGKGKWQGLGTLTFHLLFDTFCNIKPMLKQNEGEQLISSTTLNLALKNNE